MVNKPSSSKKHYEFGSWIEFEVKRINKSTSFISRWRKHSHSVLANHRSCSRNRDLRFFYSAIPS